MAVEDARAIQVAQTNLQLYNQLRERGLSSDELALVHRAYELLTTLYAGHFQADGKPFIAHGVGVASIVADLGQPAEMIAVGLLHNVYGNGDFGDGKADVATPSRRRIVREAVGDRVDELLVRFRGLRVRPHNVEQVRRGLPKRTEIERRLMCVDLADYLEKYVDLGILYWDRGSTVVDDSAALEEELVTVARELGEPRLAEMLSNAFAAAAANREQVPATLRPSDGRPYITLITPRSCKPKLSLRLRAAAREIRRRVRLRTRLREFSRAGAGRGRG